MSSSNKIRIYGDPVLRVEATEVTEFGEPLVNTISEMAQEMLAADGIGLAAPQYGISKRFFVIGLPSGENSDARKIIPFINPEIVWESDETVVIEEGCLSIPGIFEEVERPEKVHIKFQDMDGNPVELDATGTLARVIQHEYDHLDGILFIDHISSLKRTLLRGKLKKMKSEHSS